MLGKTEGGEEKVMTEDEMVGWYHRLNGHEFSKLQEMVKDREACVPQSIGLQSRTQLND